MSKRAGSRAGMRALSRHDDIAAMRLLHTSIDSRKADDRALVRDLYWFSIALLRLGRIDLAVKSLATAQKLAPRGHARRLYARLANGYGMVRSACEEHDDFRAFYTVQVKRYLGSRTRFRDDLEREAISRTIADAWISFSREPGFIAASCSEKLALFQKVAVDFPFSAPSPEARIVAGDFRKGKAQGFEDRCLCGSGLPFRMCCGRTIAPTERVSG